MIMQVAALGPRSKIGLHFGRCIYVAISLNGICFMSLRFSESSTNHPQVLMGIALDTLDPSWQHLAAGLNGAACNLGRRCGCEGCRCGEGSVEDGDAGTLIRQRQDFDLLKFSARNWNEVSFMSSLSGLVFGEPATSKERVFSLRLRI